MIHQDPDSPYVTPPVNSPFSYISASSVLLLEQAKAKARSTARREFVKKILYGAGTWVAGAVAMRAVSALLESIWQ